MRAFIPVLAATLVASPALAQQPTAEAEPTRIPSELTDPETMARLGDMMQVLSKAMLSLPVGEIQAAAEGRAPTAHDEGVTVRDLARRDDPNFERNLERQIAAAKPVMQGAMQALTSALPAIMRSMAAAGEELERATANIPRPDYPKR